MARLAVLFLILFAPNLGFCAEPRHSARFENPFGRAHLTQPVQSILDVTDDLLPRGKKMSLEALNRYVRLKDSATGEIVQTQWSELNTQGGNGYTEATAEYIIDLPAQTTRTLELVGAQPSPAVEIAPIRVTENKRAGTIEVQTGRVGVRLPAQGSKQPPVLGVCRLPVKLGEQGSEKDAGRLPWKGTGRFVNTPTLEKSTLERSQVGPVYYRQTMRYEFAGGLVYRCAITCWAGQDYVTVEERTEGPGSRQVRWELDLEDWPTHVYTASNWATHSLGGYRHSGTYDEFPLAGRKNGEDVVRLPNYLIWTVREEAILACLLRQADKDSEKRFEPDTLMICSVRRGEWEDKLFESTAKTPLSAHPDWPWSTRRWWGSPEGAIRIVRNHKPTTGASVRFALVPGTRAWALWTGDSSMLPAPLERTETSPLPSLVKTAIGEVRLTELQDHKLDWPTNPTVEHPRIEMTRAMVSEIDEKASSHPFFAGSIPNLESNLALKALRTNDKALAATVANEVLGDIHSRINYPVTDGIEFSSHLSPVGIRPVFQHAAQVDILLGGNLLDEDIQKRLKAAFAYLAYRLCDSSFMAYKYNAGHPNFDADRYCAIAAIAMLYPEHPHARQWMDHAASCMRESMRVYVIPDSGKWAENLGNYYSWSAAINGVLASAMKRTGNADPYAWPEFRNFWKWALVTVLPPKPTIGRNDDSDSATLPATRQMAAVGDVSNDGGHPLHGAFALAGADMMEHDPELGKHLLWIWDQGGKPGVGQSPVGLFFGLDGKHLQIAENPASAPGLVSRKLTGYGSIFRADFGKPTESYILFKCGPGGYRYHGEEGSFVLFGLGQPLTLDTGASGNADQHSTIVFGNRGLERGRVVQFESTPELDYVCGRFPGQPGELGGGFDSAQPPNDRSSSGVETSSNELPMSAAAKRTILTRQILFRKNDYIVIRDEMNSIADSHWYLLLLAKELVPSRGQVLAKGFLGVDVKVSLFRVRPGSDSLEPVDAPDIQITPSEYKQQRIEIDQPPGVSVMAVIDFYKTGDKPLTVKADNGALLLSRDNGAVTETIRMSGKDVPAAEWKRKGGGTAEAWRNSGMSDSWVQSE